MTTTTISREQYELARERVAEAGLSDRVELLLEDYRDLSGQYDKLVSIEMIEAVGHQFLDTYFAQCSRLLKDDGAMLLQAITMQDQRYLAARDSEAAPPVDYDVKWEAMRPVLDREIPVIASVANLLEIESAMTFADEHRLRLVLAGGTDTWRVADRLARRDIPVLVTNVHSVPPSSLGYDHNFSIPRRLHEAGVTRG